MVPSATRVFLSLLLFAVCASAYGVERYAVQPTGRCFTPTAINERGDIAGVTYGVIPYRALLWTNGATLDLGTLGGPASTALGLNDRGEVVGIAEMANLERRAFLYHDGVMNDLGTLPGGRSSAATGINAAGQIVGSSEAYCGSRCPSCPDCIVWRAFRYHNGTMIDLGTLGGESSYGISINANGDIVGGSDTADGERKPFVFRNGVMTALLGGPDHQAEDINASGTVIGRSYGFSWEGGGDGWVVMTGSGAIIWIGGGVEELDPALGPLGREPLRINDRDQVIGNHSDLSQRDRIAAVPFLWENWRAQNLESLLVPGAPSWTISAAMDINNRGQIAAIGPSDEHGCEALRLDPVPTAVEYHHRSFDHYFITALPNEISALDSGTFSGWERTGQSFGVLPLNAAGSANVCRFWSHQTFAPKSSHFYTPFDWECAIVKGDPVWSFEGEMFAINLPDQNGNCPAGTLPLYRLYNDGQSAAPNHRYTTSLTTWADMIVQGWIPEGSGVGVIGCVLAR